MGSYLEAFSKWLQLKIYQFEVTLSIYIYTPLEKFVFYSVSFLLCSLTFIACTLYLPQHLVFIFDRAWFYMHGDSPETLMEVVKEAGYTLAKTATASAAAITDAARVVREL
ncbi:hypothetical protein GQ53DRAFT_754329 [Thozetella sp. PMI_491]|nr:hypothetical protein GQ53DRAFT_754329 [Thozetella sp. PMI_491]